MNERDRQNLNFLLSATPEQIDEWHKSVPPDDVNYAMDLLLQYAIELDMLDAICQADKKVEAMGDVYPEAMAALHSVM